MGAGIAEVAATHGYDVVLVDVAEEQLRRADERIRRSLGRAVERGRLTAEQREDAFRHLTMTTRLDDVVPAHLVVEAVFEDPAVKAKTFQMLDSLCSPETILATNTSSISITQIASATRRPDRVVGMHFFNPVPVMKLVEIIRGMLTSDETARAVYDLAERFGKTPVEVSDSPGFVSNRLLGPMINEAAYALMEGVATREAIDQVMRLGANHPMGPLELADFIGIDVVVNIMKVLHDGFGDDKYRPCPLLVKMVAAGRLGRKSGEGFYAY
ncbi:MAG: 3-hydroxybutyryl-CoA dehydrogenase [Chloroflexi bacterium]|nr:3-hydroxybutyryl-CoA dehydrogenase [Chloroflexota bacterium]